MNGRSAGACQAALGKGDVLGMEHGVRCGFAPWRATGAAGFARATGRGPGLTGAPRFARATWRGTRRGGPLAAAHVSRRQPAGLERDASDQQHGEHDEQERRGSRGGHVLEVAGRIRLDGLDVFPAGIDQPADQRRDQGDDPGGQQPAAEHEPEHEHARPHGTEERPERRTRHVHPGWRAVAARRPGAPSPCEHPGRGRRSAPTP